MRASAWDRNRRRSQLAFQRREETLAHRVIVAVADRSVDGRTPATRQRLPKSIEVYCDPWTLSCLSSTRWGGEYAVDLAGHVTLQAAHDLAFGPAPPGSCERHRLEFRRFAFGTRPMCRAELAWRLPPRLRRWRCVFPLDAGIADAAHHGEARLGAEPIRVIPNGDHYCACVLGAHAFELKQTGGELLDQGRTMNRSSSAISSLMSRILRARDFRESLVATTGSR